MKNLIGVSAKKRMGKDSFYEAVQTHFPEYQNMKFAHKLKQICALITGRDISDFYDGNKCNDVIEDYGMTIRNIQQKIGTECLRDNFYDDIWVKALFSEWNPSKKWIITDVRFPNEAEMIKSKGGILIRIERPSVLVDDSHKSEIALDDYKDWDHIIINDGTLEEYHSKILKIIRDC